MSYESVQFHGSFIRHNGLHLWVNSDNGHDPLFKQDTTFLKKAGAAGFATPIGERIAVYADCHTQPLASGVTASNQQICIGRNLQIWPAGVPAGHCPTLPVGAVGDGECTDLVQAALAFAHGVAGTTVVPYTWGTAVGTNTVANARRGDIIQFQATQFKETHADGSWVTWGTNDKHTAIISAINGTKVTLVEQNVVPANSPPNTPTLREVQTSLPREFSGTLLSGTYTVYRPTEAP